ncbi:GNAT family N-acetyltransferase [Kitasatospora sp. NPDC088391]|uniref:GNAT family N-acetyltransferase n=1 Tax=Kitasatospora sp. NPDC088391 TaxID=3364074 RepID=UPI0037FA356D
MSLSATEVAAAGDAWVWSPPDAEVVSTDGYTLVRLPDYFEFDLSVVSFTPAGPLGPAVDALLERARTFDVPVLDWQVLIGAPAGLAAELAARGGRVKLELEVLAADLSDGVPALRPSDLDVATSWATDPATARDALVLQQSAFGGELPPADRFEAAAARNRDSVPAGRGGTLVAHLDGVPVGSAGVELVDGVARLTGGVVAEQWRGRGVYRALIGARLAYAAAHGARMALVKANPTTSGPILRKVGFTPFGPEPVYAVPLR